MRKTVVKMWVCVVGMVLGAYATGEAAQMGTAFTYQGRLSEAGVPAEGEYDFEFKLYDDPNVVVGVQQGSTVNKDDQQVSAGLFTVQLDFGSDVFDGDTRYLEIGVRPGAETGAYTTLSTCQEITPYALHTRWLLVDEDLYNVFAGKGAGASNTTGYRNSAVGLEALNSNTTGSNNVGVGVSANYYNEEGSEIRLSAIMQEGAQGRIIKVEMCFLATMRVIMKQGIINSI